MDQTDATLTKQRLNNFIIKNKPIACKGKKFVIDKLMRQVKKLRQKKAKSEEQKKLFERKADRLVEEAVILKKIRAATVLKFGLLNKKSFAAVVSSPDCKIEERALCRLMEQKHLHEVVSTFRKNYPNYASEVPLIIQTLGIQKINNRKKKMSILKKWDKLDPYLQTEELNVKIMKDLLGIDINTGLLRICKRKKCEEFGKTNEREKETNQRVDMKVNNRKKDDSTIEKQDLRKIKESPNKGNLRIEQVIGNDKSKLDFSVSANQVNVCHDQSDDQVSENEEEGNEEDSSDQDENSDVDEDDSEKDVLQEEEDNDDHEKHVLHQYEEDNHVLHQNEEEDDDDDLEEESHGDDSEEESHSDNSEEGSHSDNSEEGSHSDNSEDDAEDVIEQNYDSPKKSKDKLVYKPSNVKSDKVGEKIMAKRKLTETCHYDDDLIGNKHDEGFPSKSKKSCNMPDPLLAQNLKGSGTADVRILSLSEHDGVIERCDSIKSDSSEEDFFFRDKAKKKDKRKNLFDPHENAEDSSKMLSENDRKRGFDQDEKIIDTSIYFRRNLYRKVGETENRDQGQESRGFDEERRSERGRPSWRNNDSGRGRPSWRSNDSERGRPSWRNNDSGRGRPSWRNDNSRNKGNFERRGGKWKFSQDNPNEIPVDFNWEDKRRRVTDAKDWSNNVNKQKDKGTGFESNEGTKTAANKGQREEGLHPSWQAKRRERQQEVSINQFKGQRIVFE